MHAPADDVRLKRLEQLSYFLDNSLRVPGTGYRIGYDALIGLVPGIGDLLGAVLSVYIVLEAARFRLPFSTVLRMALNVGLEVLVGTVPLLGDVFDAAWKANARNVALLRERLAAGDAEAARKDRLLVGAVAFGLVLLVVGLGAGVVLLLRGLAGLIGF